MRVRTGYSFRTAVGTLESVLDRLQACNYPVTPISDRASTFGFVRWNKLCAKRGVRPVFGVELGVTASINGGKRPVVDYWTFFAKDDLRSIHDLVELASKQFRYEPLLTYEQAMAATGVVKIVGNRAQLDHCYPQDNLYVALSPSASKGYVKRCQEAGFDFIASSDNKYPLEDDQQFYEVLCGRGASTQTYAQHILTTTEWADAVCGKIDITGIDRAVCNFDIVAECCKAELKQGSLLKPERPMSLRSMCVNGAEELGVDLCDPVYRERLDRELDLIAEKGFEDYFYIIADLCHWARTKMLVGPARGSSCGSLVCYLTSITTVDPIKYDLIFERFIDINRSDLPDIDIDFSDTRRDEIFTYLSGKYGSERVAKLGTVAIYKARSAAQETAAALDVPRWKADKVLECLPDYAAYDDRWLTALGETLHGTREGRNLLTEFPEFELAARLEGHPRHYSRHAAGVLLTEEPVRAYVAVDARTGGTHCDKADAEALDLLKIDALGLTQLSVFEDALALAGLSRCELEQVSLDDQAAFDILNEGKFCGIFQFAGPALQRQTRQIRVTELEDLVALTALCRPGPLATGAPETWAKRKQGQEEVTYPHPLLEPILKATRGVLIYQEQIMRICREIGRMSWEDVTKVRKAVAKSQGQEIEKYGEAFKSGAINSGLPDRVAAGLWSDMVGFGSYAFNRSHSVAYAILSYWSLWLKAHYPYEFAAATLTHETDPTKQIRLLRELSKEGIGYIPFDMRHSGIEWQPAEIDGKRVLVGPVQNIKGVGPKAMKLFTNWRSGEEGIDSLPKKLQTLLTNPTTSIDSLWPIRDAFERLLPDPKAKGIVTIPTLIEEIQNSTLAGEFVVFCHLTKITQKEDGSLNLQLADDSDSIFGKVYKSDKDTIGKGILEQGKGLYAMKGTVKAGAFRMFVVKKWIWIGEYE